MRGDDGVLRALSNVCRHRAMRLLDGTGSCPKVLRCPYHGWTYRQDGQLAAVPEARGSTPTSTASPCACRRSASRSSPGSCSSASTPTSSRWRPGSATSGRASRRSASATSSRSGRTSRPTAATGRTSPTTSSRATTSRSAIRGCCACSTTSATRRTPGLRHSVDRRAVPRQDLEEPHRAPLPALPPADAGLPRGARGPLDVRPHVPGHDGRHVPGPARHLARWSRTAPTARARSRGSTCRTRRACARRPCAASTGTSTRS